MKKIVYVGPAQHVEVAAVPGGFAYLVPVDVPDDIAASLLEQDTFEIASPTKESK